MIFRMLFGVVMVTLLQGTSASAKIVDPKPLVIEGIEYSSHTNEVVAIDIKSRKVLWKTVLPVDWQQQNNGNLEADVQWNIITELRLHDMGELSVKFRRGNMFMIDRMTGKWREVPHLPSLNR